MLEKAASPIKATQALPGRTIPIRPEEQHAVFGRAIDERPANHARLLLGMGCFWGAERRFWQLKGVYLTSVGYAGGLTPNPTYEEVCSGSTGHTEVVAVTYPDSAEMLALILKCFWESHNPTQGMRQGNDRGTQYRSVVLCETEGQLDKALKSGEAYQEALTAEGLGRITTQLGIDLSYYLAESYHQQYLHKNPRGYCGLGGTGVCLG